MAGPMIWSCLFVLPISFFTVNGKPSLSLVCNGVLVGLVGITAVSVHGVCGFLGTVMTGLFATEGGFFYGGGWKFLGIETLGVTVTVAWAFILGYTILKALDKIWGIRVEPLIVPSYFLPRCMSQKSM